MSSLTDLSIYSGLNMSGQVILELATISSQSHAVITWAAALKLAPVNLRRHSPCDTQAKVIMTMNPQYYCDAHCVFGHSKYCCDCMAAAFLQSI